MKRRPTPGVIVLDLRAAFRAFREMAAAVGRLADSLTSEGRLKRSRGRLGGMAYDARRWPDRWQSTVCAGLLCGITPCPSDANGLQCTCRCHERPGKETA